MFRLGIVLAIAAVIGLPLQKEYWPVYTFFGLAVIVVGLISVTALIFWYAAKTKKD